MLNLAAMLRPPCITSPPRRSALGQSWWRARLVLAASNTSSPACRPGCTSSSATRPRKAEPKTAANTGARGSLPAPALALRTRPGPRLGLLPTRTSPACRACATCCYATCRCPARTSASTRTTSPSTTGARSSGSTGCTAKSTALALASGRPTATTTRSTSHQKKTESPIPPTASIRRCTASRGCSRTSWPRSDGILQPVPWGTPTSTSSS